MQNSLSLPSVIAHRGASADAPENTFAAIALAIKQGAKWIEVDVNISSDGELFIHHDDSLSRCTNGQGYLVGTSAKNLSELDAGSWFAPKYAGEKIPTLAQLTEFLLPHGTGVNLEIKATAGADITLARAVCEFIDQSWPEELPLLASSFSVLALKEFRYQLPDHELGLLVCDVPDDWQDWMQEFQCDTLHCAASFVTPELCDDARDAGFPVLCYTVNDPEEASRLLDMGVTSVFTDRTQILLDRLT